MVGPKVTRDVNTELRYWTKPIPGNAVTLDFTQPDSDKHHKFLKEAKSSYPVTIRDIRGRECEYSLYKNGFQYVHHEVPELDPGAREEEIERLLVPATEQLVKDMTGATKVITHCARIRSKATDNSNFAENKSPALDVHSDFTPVGALQNVTAKFKDSAELEALHATHRFLAINVWRPLRPITRDPLAVLDWTSCNYKREWISLKYLFTKTLWNVLGSLRYNPEHMWCYLSHQTPSEPLVFTQHDSEAIEEGGRCTAHSAFVDPEYADGPARESIEIKMYVFVPK